MTGQLAALIALATVAACGGPAPTPAPAPALAPDSGQAPVAAPAPGASVSNAPVSPPPAAPRTRPRGGTVAPPQAAPTTVPPFQAESLITWGPLPTGTPHGERHRTYDLRHQIVHVRFDWPRHAVVGSTTLTVAGLGDAPPTREIALDAVGMRIGAVTSSAGAPLPHEYDGRTLTVHVPLALRPTRPVTFTVAYETVHPKKGAYFIDRRHIMWTQGEMEDTRYWLPTYDEPNDKTTWEFFIRTSRTEKALSNGRLVGSRDVDGETEWHWSQTTPASTYLMTAVTGDYVVAEDKWRTIPIGYWTYPDSVQAAWRGFGETPRAVDLFSTTTGVDYPWAKYDQIVAPDYIFGGMENVTATTQNDDEILHPAWAEPDANAASLMAHELGHQWYGDYLTMASWTHAWLNEGFATFMEQTYIESAHGIDEGTYDRLRALEDVVDADRAARRPVVYDRWVNDPLELFTIIYSKGAAALQMLRHQLGDSLFWTAMHRYTVDHALGVVTTSDFERSVEQATGRDLAPFFKQWLYGAGMPAFQVSAAYDTATKQVTFTARQVQPRDSLTGFFDATVDVAVFTDHGVVHGTVPVHGEESQGSITVDGPPRALRWDVGRWLLQVYDFPRSTAMLVYQLQRDSDVAGRLEAVDLLRTRQTEPAAALALADAARHDPFWAVRSTAVAALGDLAGAAALDASRDRDPRVREAAAKALGAAGAPGSTVSRLRDLASADSSLYVRGDALIALAHVDTSAAMPLIRTALGVNSWTDMVRASALHALSVTNSPETFTLASQLSGPGNSRVARIAAIRPLLAAAGATGRQTEAAAVLTSALSDNDLFIREAAAQALGALGATASVALLEARKRVEAEGRVLTAIDEALERLRGAGH